MKDGWHSVEREDEIGRGWELKKESNRGQGKNGFLAGPVRSASSTSQVLTATQSASFVDNWHKPVLTSNSVRKD